MSALRRWVRAILAALADVPWRMRALVGLTVGAATVAVVGVVEAVRVDNKFFGVVMAAMFGLMVASQALLRREMTERLATSRKHWFASSPRGLAELDTDLRIVEGNARLTSLLATEESDLEGSLLTQYFPLEQAAGIVAQFKTLSSGAVNTIESDSLGMRSDNTRIWLHWRATTVRRANGDLDYFVITFEDTTQKHAAAKAAQANLSELEKLYHLKSEFTALVSHEFRTALTGIQGMSELINGGKMKPDEVQEYSGYIFKEAERINRLITDMLDLDRLESGKMTMHMVPVDLNATIQDVVDRTAAVCRTHTFVTDLDPARPRVLGDADRLIQVLTNLLSNAIKYSPDGGEIVVSSQLAGSTAQINVTDHGVGIPAEFVDQLFGRFERYEANPTKVIGTGLGLAITRQIIEMHGGRIWVERGETDGSVFHLTIPAHAAAMPVLKQAPSAAAA